MEAKKANGGYVIPAGYPPSNIELEAKLEANGYYKLNDPINHPDHYNQGKIEVIEFIEDQELPYHEANAVKYICRSRFKGNRVQDLKKAVWYLNRRITTLEKTNAGK